MAQLLSPVIARQGVARPHRASIPALLVSASIFAILWIVLTGAADASSWILGLPSVIAATWSHARLLRRGGARLSFSGGLSLLPVFLWESFKGGIDVARRVLRPRVDVEPGFFEYELGLIPESARVFFVDLVSLLPGTLSADIHGDRMRIHTLDVGTDSVPELLRLERRVAALYGARRPQRAAPHR